MNSNQLPVNSREAVSGKRQAESEDRLRSSIIANYFPFFFSSCLLLFLSACSANLDPQQYLDPEKLLNPPRLATQTALAVAAEAPEVQPTVTEIPLVVETPTPISAEIIRPETTVNQTITVWINETSDAHVDALKPIGDRFMQQHGVQVEFVFVDTQNVVALARSAQLTEQLPDIIMHNWEQAATLLALGILDPEAAQAVVDELGAETFRDGALEAFPLADGNVVSVPTDGWSYLLFYRQDWFAEAGLDAPDTLEKILVSAETFDTITLAFEEVTPTPTPAPDETPEPEILRSGIVIPTEQDLPSTQRVFEWVAMANGCELSDDAGAIIIETPACLDTLEYYRDLVNRFSPPDYQTDITALRAFAEGRTAMAFLPPSALRYFAENGAPQLTNQVGVVTQLVMSGTVQTAAFSQINYLSIVDNADEAALAFVNFWFDEAYIDWLAVEPERKYPLRSISGDNEMLPLWSQIPSANGQPLDQLYDSTGDVPLSELLGRNLLPINRWGGGNRELLASQMAEQLTIAPVLQRLLSGYIGSSQAIIDIAEEIYELDAQPVDDDS